MESTMCHDDGVDYSTTSSPSPVYTVFFFSLRLVIINTALLLFLFFLQHTKDGARSRIYPCWPRASPRLHHRLHCCALRTRFIPPSPASPPALIPGHLPQIPIGDGSALEFIPHHPAELWPSNSQPLWPRQMNNKTRALQLISGKKKKREKKTETARCQPLSFMGACVPVERGKDVRNTGYSGYPALGGGLSVNWN